MDKKNVILGAVVILILMIGAVLLSKKPLSEKKEEGIFMPGTQPEAISLDPTRRCLLCHEDTTFNNAADSTWKGSMMANAQKDPLYLAALAIANQDMPMAGDYCMRCHTPVGWLEGRSKPFDASGLVKEDYTGVNCDFCHRMIDPLSQEGKLNIDPEVTEYGNGMYVVAPESTTKRGPLREAISNGHKTMHSGFFKKGEYCGVCHNVTNPENGLAVERTYAEWEKSWYASQGEAGSCQSCHMKKLKGYASGPYLKTNAPLRDNLSSHDFAGGSAWIQDTLPLLWKDADSKSLQANKEKSLKNLKEAAKVTVKILFKDNNVIARVRVYNKTGHKLPSGYPEGRRMWINLKAFLSNDRLMYESGEYDFENAVLKKDDQLKTYEIHQGIKGKGATFHFVLNDYIVKDNRIPPKGFLNSAFEEVGAAPVGYKYNDGQYWDDTYYKLPSKTDRVKVTLYYQSASKEYVEFLASKNKSDEWGKKLLEVWKKTEKSKPVEMATATDSFK
ncbi:MAG: hypothetical protein HY776_02910 [Actinobacteria bacterium]|nr:hypothetical protein [Actinomycetota bacterium]